jgi:hypothetical protein
LILSITVKSHLTVNSSIEKTTKFHVIFDLSSVKSKLKLQNEKLYDALVNFNPDAVESFAHQLFSKNNSKIYHTRPKHTNPDWPNAPDFCGGNSA